MNARALVAPALFLAACGGGDERDVAPVAPPSGASVSSGAPDAEARFVFSDVAAVAGLTAVSWCGRPEKPHLLESGGNGVALFDYDGDGFLDVFVTSGWRLEGDRVVEKPKNHLYRNRGDGTFDDVTDAVGVGGDGASWTTGCAVGDFDLDGRPDLLVTGFGKDVLWHNEGNGRFARVAEFEGIDGWSTGACFFDADGDGWPDLYIAAYVDCTVDDVLHAKATLDWKNTKVMVGPFGLKGKADAFFHNNQGKLVRSSADFGLRDAGEYYGFGVAAADLDGNGALDLYVANDSNPSYLFKNDGHGRFTESGLWCGAGLSGTGAAQAGMGVAIGDFDGDGLPDILLTTFADDSATLFKNLGRGLFRDVSASVGLRDPTFRPLKWGVVFADFDLDGDEDVFIACGHIYPQADEPGTDTKYAQRNLLLENVGGQFRDVTSAAGPGLQIVKSSRGVAMGDIDNDGDVDLLVSNVDAAPTLLRNDTPRRGNHWLLVDAPDALKVVVEAGGRKFTRFFVAGGSYCSASDPRFHFGLGAAATADRVTVKWQRGGEAVLTDVAADGIVRVKRP